jgi:hypothetical protein
MVRWTCISKPTLQEKQKKPIGCLHPKPNSFPCCGCTGPKRLHHRSSTARGLHQQSNRWAKDDWSARKYNDVYAKGPKQKNLGLSRATALLHFLSGGHFPIFDSRVRKAMSRLLNSSVPNRVHWYLDSYCPLFLEVAAVCGTRDLRMVDMALFSYGERKLPFSN